MKLEPAICALAQRAADGERLTDAELDLAFDALGVSTEAQLVAAAVARGAKLYRFSDPPITDAQRAYLAAFDRWLRSQSLEDDLKRAEALQHVLDDAGVTPPRYRRKGG